MHDTCHQSNSDTWWITLPQPSDVSKPLHGNWEPFAQASHASQGHSKDRESYHCKEFKKSKEKGRNCLHFSSAIATIQVLPRPHGSYKSWSIPSEGILIISCKLKSLHFLYFPCSLSAWKLHN